MLKLNPIDTMLCYYQEEMLFACANTWRALNYRDKVLQFWQQGKLIGAICHGILVLTRTIDPQTGQSVLYGHKVTALPRSLDRFAYLLDSWFIKHGYISILAV